MQGKKDDSPFEMILAVAGLGAIILVVIGGTFFYFLYSPEPPKQPARQKVVKNPPQRKKAAQKADSVVRRHKAATSPQQRKRPGHVDSSDGNQSSSGGGSGQSSTGGTPVPRTSGSSGNSGPEVIKKFRGEGHESLPAFSVSGSWKLKWESAGLFFAGYLYHDKTDKLVKTIKSKSTSEADESLEGGRYYLKINASSEWRVLVVKE